MPHSSGRTKTAHPLPGSAADSERPTDDVGRKSAGLHESVGETTAAGFRFRFHAWALRLRLLPPQRVIQAASLWDWKHRQAACLTALPGLTHPKSISGISGMEGPLRVVRTKSGPIALHSALAGRAPQWVTPLGYPFIPVYPSIRLWLGQPGVVDGCHSPFRAHSRRLVLS